MQLNYSIIIPHKNSPQLLQRCLDSIPKRGDLEVIIVDNNSSDDIVDFDHYPGFDRKGVKILYDNESKGAGGARNIGLKEAKGKWILFVDADDFFNYCIHDILNDYIGVDDKDIIFFKINSVYSDTYVNSKRGWALNKAIDRYKTNKEKSTAELRFSFFSPWGKLIRKDFLTINHICFEDTVIMNDNYFGYHLGYYADNIAVDNRAICCITERPGSVSKNKSPEAIIECIRIKTDAELFYQKHRIPASFLKNANYHFFWVLLKEHRAFWRNGLRVFLLNGIPLRSIVIRMSFSEIVVFFERLIRNIQHIFDFWRK